MSHLPFDYIGESERGILTTGHPRIFYILYPGLRPGEVTPVTLFAATESTQEEAFISQERLA